jgi:predicted Zn-dependent protease
MKRAAPPASCLLLSACLFLFSCKDSGARETAENLYIAALDSYTEQQYGKALELVRNARSHDKKFHQARLLEAKILFFDSKEAEAEKQFAALVAKYPSYTEARIWHIRCLILSGGHEAALSELESELSFNTSDWRVYYLYALLGAKTNNYEQRLSMNRKAEAVLGDSACTGENCQKEYGK